MRSMSKIGVLALTVMLGCAHASPAASAQLECDLVAAAEVPTDVHDTTAGYQRPSSVNPSCVGSEISRSLPHIDKTKLPQRPVTFRFVVLADGRPAGLQWMSRSVEREFACAVWQAVSRCSWKPGRDPEGRPVPTWLLVPLSVR